MKKVLFLFLAIMLSFSSFAQDNDVQVKSLKLKRYGVKTGLSLARFHNTHQFDIGSNDSYSKLAGFSGGYYMDAIGESGHYSTQFGIQYTGMGTNFEADDTKIRLHYIQLPLTFNARVGYKSFNAFFGGGAYGAVAFMGKNEYTDPTSGEKATDKEILSFPGKEDGDLKPLSYFDTGFIVGGGLEFVLPNDHALQLGFHFYRSILPVSNATSYRTNDQGEPVAYNPGIQNRSFIISLSYLVKGK